MSRPATERLRIDVCLDPGELTRIMAEEVRAGLTAKQKRLPSKYFYDARGSELFERITELPEYYQTRTELGPGDERARRAGLGVLDQDPRAARRYGTSEVIATLCAVRRQRGDAAG